MVPSTSPFASPGRRIWPVVPESIYRYDRRRAFDISEYLGGSSDLYSPSQRLARHSNVLDPFDFKFEGIAILKENPELPQKPTHNKTPVNVQMFSKARDVSIRDTEINNVGGDYTINHNYNVYLRPDSEPLSTSDQYSNPFSNLKSKIFRAVQTVNRFLPLGRSVDIAPPFQEKVAEDALKYPPLFNVPVFLSKTSLFKDGVVNQLLSSVRYAFFCELPSLP